MDVPVKTQVPVERPELLRRQSHRRRDAEHLHHGIRLVQKMATPGTATSQGTDFNDIRIFRTPLFPRNSFLTKAVFKVLRWINRRLRTLACSRSYGDVVRRNLGQFGSKEIGAG